MSAATGFVRVARTGDVARAEGEGDAGRTINAVGAVAVAVRG